MDFNKLANTFKINAVCPKCSYKYTTLSINKKEFNIYRNSNYSHRIVTCNKCGARFQVFYKDIVPMLLNLEKQIKKQIENQKKTIISNKKSENNVINKSENEDESKNTEKTSYSGNEKFNQSENKR